MAICVIATDEAVFPLELSQPGLLIGEKTGKCRIRCKDHADL
jgi:hypothetical protein